MPHAVTIQQEPINLQIAASIAAEGFVVPQSDALAEDVKNHLSHGAVYHIRVDGISKGFAIFLRFPPGVLYLSGIILRSDFQGKHLCEQVVQLAREPGDQFLALRTQSSIMWSAGKRICGESWTPKLNGYDDPRLSALGATIAARIGCRSYPMTPEFYGASLYGKKPQHRDATLQAAWDALCDFERGDAVVCIGHLP